MEAVITKSNYLAGLQCVKKLWLGNYAPAKAAPPGPFQDAVFKRGTEVGVLARELFPEGILISSAGRKEALEETAAVLASISALTSTAVPENTGIAALFEPAFQYKGLFCRVDILSFANRGGWDLIEVKSTLDVQDLQLPDAAVQKYILQNCGLDIERTCIMHLNRACRFPDLSNLFVLEEVDDLIAEEIRAVPGPVAAFQEVLKQNTEPDVQIGDHCREPYECGFIHYCWKDLPSPSIYSISRMDRGRRKDLTAQNILSPFDIPDTYPLSRGEQRQVDLYKGGRPKIGKDAVRKELESLRFPLYFLDFETDNPAVPRYRNTGPYNQVPFQYSLHILDASGRLQHREYLHTDATDPRSPLAEQLAADLLNLTGTEVGNSRFSGTIIAYYASFEKQVIGKLMPFFNEAYRAEMKSALKRFWDLLDIFRKYYRDPKFLGSNSLKSVLPVLVPEMDYAGLDVKNGSEAQLAWNTMLDPEVLPAEKAGLEQALRIYCRQDTLAMVEIYRVLQKLVY